jgi:hypothetical protein
MLWAQIAFLAIRILLLIAFVHALGDRRREPQPFTLTTFWNGAAIEIATIILAYFAGGLNRIFH